MLDIRALVFIMSQNSSLKYVLQHKLNLIFDGKRMYTFNTISKSLQYVAFIREQVLLAS